MYNKQKISWPTQRLSASQGLCSSRTAWD